MALYLFWASLVSLLIISCGSGFSWSSYILWQNFLLSAQSSLRDKLYIENAASSVTSIPTFRNGGNWEINASPVKVVYVCNNISFLHLKVDIQIVCLEYTHNIRYYSFISKSEGNRIILPIMRLFFIDIQLKILIFPKKASTSFVNWHMLRILLSNEG